MSTEAMPVAEGKVAIPAPALAQSESMASVESRLDSEAAAPASPPKPNPNQSSKSGKVSRGWSLWIQLLSWIYICGLFSTWIVTRMGGDRWYVATLAMFAPHWPLLLPAPLLVLMSLRRHRKLSWILVLTTAFYFFIGMGFCIPLKRLWPSNAAAGAAGGRLRIMTLNAHHQTTDTARLALLLQEQNPDIVLLQDFSGALLPAFAVAYPWNERRGEELFIASKFPLLMSEDLLKVTDNAKPGVGDASRFQLDTPAGVINVVTVHLASPHSPLEDFTGLGSEAGAAIERNSAQRMTESRRIHDAVGGLAGLIVAGDFNTPPESVIFRDVWPDLKDTYSESGFGFGFTYYTRKMRFRIDHILVSQGWVCLNSWVGADVGSAHRPLFADLQHN